MSGFGWSVASCTCLYWLFVSVFDWLFVSVFDSLFVSVFDSLFVSVFDGLFVSVFDWLFVIQTYFTEKESLIMHSIECSAKESLNSKGRIDCAHCEETFTVSAAFHTTE